MLCLSRIPHNVRTVEPGMSKDNFQLFGNSCAVAEPGVFHVIAVFRMEFDNEIDNSRFSTLPVLQNITTSLKSAKRHDFPELFSYFVQQTWQRNRNFRNHGDTWLFQNTLRFVDITKLGKY